MRVTKIEKIDMIRHLLHVISMDFKRKIGSRFDSNLHGIDVEALGFITCKKYRAFKLPTYRYIIFNKITRIYFIFNRTTNCVFLLN
jgi:hypothetical protein